MGHEEHQTVRTGKLDVASLPAPSRLCWPGHLDTQQIQRNRQEATWPAFTITWITFCCCQPGTAFSNSFHPLRQWFSLLTVSCGSPPPPLHTVCFCSDFQSHIHLFARYLRSAYSLHTCAGLASGAVEMHREMWFLPPRA